MEGCTLHPDSCMRSRSWALNAVCSCIGARLPPLPTLSGRGSGEKAEEEDQDAEPMCDGAPSSSRSPPRPLDAKLRQRGTLCMGEKPIDIDAAPSTGSSGHSGGAGAPLELDDRPSPPPPPLPRPDIDVGVASPREARCTRSRKRRWRPPGDEGVEGEHCIIVQAER